MMLVLRLSMAYGAGRRYIILGTNDTEVFGTNDTEFFGTNDTEFSIQTIQNSRIFFFGTKGVISLRVATPRSCWGATPFLL